MNNEYGNDIIKLTDDEGQEYSFEVLDAVETDDGRYVALMPVFDDPKEMLDDEGDLVKNATVYIVKGDFKCMISVTAEPDSFDEIPNLFEKI